MRKKPQETIIFSIRLLWLEVQVKDDNRTSQNDVIIVLRR